MLSRIQCFCDDGTDLYNIGASMNRYNEEQLDWLTLFFGMMQDGCTKEEAITYLATMDAGAKIIKMCLQHLENENG